MGTQVPWVFLPVGPLGWGSHEQILPRLIRIWEANGAKLVPLCFPRPQLTAGWARRFEREASVAVFPLGLGHYDALWTLTELRRKFRSRVPARIMVASDLTKGFASLFDHASSLRSADVLITNCSAERRLARAAFGAKIKAVTLRLPVDLGLFRPRTPEERASIKTELGLRPAEPLLVYAGRLSAQKNILGLLAAFAELRKLESGGTLFLLGSADDVGIPHFQTQNTKRYIHQISELIQKLGLESSVRFPGLVSQPELARVLSACDLQVSLSLHSGEDFGYSIAQGMACGAPTVLSHWGGHQDFIRAGGAIGVPVVLTDNGPRVSVPRAAASMRYALRSAEKLRGTSATFACRELNEAVLSRSWQSVLRAQGQARAAAIAPSEAFQKAYRRAQEQGVFVFSSGRDPLYRRITRIYGATEHTASRFADMHPLLDLSRGELEDPVAPVRALHLSKAELRALLPMTRGSVSLRVLKSKPWGHFLLRVGAFIPR